MSILFSDQTHLLKRLPMVRGRLVAGAPMAPLVWFRTGGAAEVLYRPVDTEDLAAFMAGSPPDVAMTMIGAGSNLLVRDGGVPGVVVRLGPGLARLVVNGTRIIAGAGALNSTVARTAMQAGIAGLEFLAGIPGSIGGGVRMNAGAYNRDFAAVVTSASTIDRQGNHHTLTHTDIAFGYRHTGFPSSHIVVAATLTGQAGDPAHIGAEMANIQDRRTKTQPIRTSTGGSTFTNPPGHKAWELIEAAGCRGLTIGGAMVSPKHCNFLINTGNATSTEIEALGEEVRRRVFERTAIDLQWEIRRIGINGDTV